MWTWSGLSDDDLKITEARVLHWPRNGSLCGAIWYTKPTDGTLIGVWCYKCKRSLAPWMIHMLNGWPMSCTPPEGEFLVPPVPWLKPSPDGSLLIRRGRSAQSK